MRFAILFAVLFAAGAGAVASASAAPSAEASREVGPDLPVEGMITNPDWARKPDSDDVAASYPRLAGALGIGGKAVMQCAVSADGALQDCKVVSEQPAGFGFGTAALSMAPKFAMRPKTVNGAPVGGGSVNIPIRYTELEQDPVPPLGPAPPPLPEPAQALTARIAKALHYDERYLAQLEKELGDSSVDPARQKLAIDAVKSALIARGLWLAQFQRDMAATFNQQQLGEVAAFFESPTGQAFVARGNSAGEAEAKAIADQWPAILADARNRFCGQVQCVATAQATSPGR